ncbi:OLC1v1034947C1 [Oldenlandia corymbosa var. corymbosa]|uniref:OLC1v1034947C1 n=1 Tax=Oldenlandia corymbosa var. corymbosa TaxID=529605 RepID=A0AAV1CTK2_OLDCO|nr:OLC1v1034947C1 [Oldenlandia corymbosa var. corymbosa]
MAALSISVSNLTTPHQISSLGSISGRYDVQFMRMITYPQLSITKFPGNPLKTTIIRMGGGPRTYPGGVSKWQWKRMQAKKAKQLLKARLARERQIYEMRKRAELKAAVSELERPWEVVEKAPNLFSVSADEQLKVLADRFQKPGGFDMWSERDGPELFKTEGGLPSARYFPKGVVHSVKPYGKVEKFDDLSDEFGAGEEDDESGWASEGEGYGKLEVKGPRMGDSSSRINNGDKNLSSKLRKLSNEGNKETGSKNKYRNNYNRSNSLGRDKSAEVGFLRGKNQKSNGQRDHVIYNRRRNSVKAVKHLESTVFDMTLQKDGSYELEPEKRT